MESKQPSTQSRQHGAGNGGYQRHLQELGAPTWIIDPASSRFLDANAEAILQLGYDLNEVRKLSVTDINEAVPDAAVWQQLTAQMKPGDTVVYGADLLCKSGNRVSVEITLSCQLCDSGKVFVAVTRAQTHEPITQ